MSQETLSGASNAQDAKLPPGLALYRLGIGHYVSRALDLATRLGVADLLANGPRDHQELADESDSNPAALRRVLRLLASVGVFDEGEDGRFSLTPMGELLRDDVPGSMRAAVMLFTGTGIQDSWRDLDYCVRTGQPAYTKDDPDADPFAAMAQDPEKAALFDRAMAATAPQTAAAVASAYDFGGFETVVDIGGGNGAILIGILAANPGLRGLVFDQPHVIERARTELAAAGVGDRCEAVGGSFFEKIPGDADAYVLKHVIHDWSDEQATEILSNCRAAMSTNAKLLILEGVYPERIDNSLLARGAAANDVNMLVCTGGRQRSEAEFRQLYAAAGFRLTRIIPTLSAVSVIEGEPA